jgi:NAD(P)-dependent dehydrogenase (short-subunit alcohol dehydrogenase family)
MKRVLVSGGNKGIGLAIVSAILEQGEDTHVFLGSRDLSRGKAARSTLLAVHPDWEKRLEVVQLDVRSDDSVAAMVSTIQKRCHGDSTPLYGIVNNAGIGGNGTPLADVFDVNTLGVRRVCSACIPLLDQEQGRIVNVTSAAGPSFVAKCDAQHQKFFTNANIEWPELAAFIDKCIAMDGDSAAFAAEGLGDGSAYGLSKACANSYTLLLARTHPNLHVNACTPGFIETDMTRGFATSRGKTPAEMGMRQPADGARCPSYLLFAELEGNGRFYGSDCERSPLDRYRAPGTEPYRG